MPTVSKVSFAAIARKKINARRLDEKLVNKGHAAVIQNKNNLFQGMIGSLLLKNRPITLRPRLCIPRNK